MNIKELSSIVEQKYASVTAYSDTGRVSGEYLGADYDLKFQTKYSDHNNYCFRWFWNNEENSNILELSNSKLNLEISDFGPLISYKRIYDEMIDEVRTDENLQRAFGLAHLFSLQGSRMFLPLLKVSEEQISPFFLGCEAKKVESANKAETFHITGLPFTYEYWVQSSDFTVRRARCMNAFLPFGDGVMKSVLNLGCYITKPFDSSLSKQLGNLSEKFCDLHYYLDELSIQY